MSHRARSSARRPSSLTWRPARLVLALPAWFIHGALMAQDAPGAPAAQTVVVTGSNVRRTDSETPSPVQVLTAADIKNSGYTSIGDVLHNITANNMGSLSQSAPSAFAAGGSGVALRGLTVGATLVLIDGHRMASYPMPDDGERDFVDISSIPIDAIERIEVLKDGASAVYGSDAIAGVVNVILKKTFTGLTMSAETGLSSHGDGATQHASITTGWGDLSKDGQNAYISVEARHANSILLRKRPYLARTDWTPYGGANLTQGTGPTGSDGNLTGQGGAVSGASSGAGSGTGYLIGTDGIPTDFYAGCTSAQATADQCGYSNPYQTLSPSTTNIDVMGRYTKSLAGGWQANLQGSVLRSEAHQVGLFNNAAATGVGIGGNGGGLNLFHFGPGAAPTPAYPDSFPFVLTVPANYPGNTTGDTAPLVYDFRDIGPLEQTVVSTSYRAVAELAGSIGEWDLNGSVGFTRVGTKASFHHYIDFPALQDALDSGSYLVDGRNSAAELATVAPDASSTSTNSLTFVSVRGNRTLATLPGGDLALGIGADFTHRDLKELFPPSFVNGSQAIGIYSFAKGKQTVSAGYAELVAPVTKELELDVAGRVDHYDTTGTSATPKAGFKFTPVQQFTLRGTFSKGFRAPNPAEVGDAGSTSGFVGNLHDPVYCPNGPASATNPNGGPIANLPDGMIDPCDIALQELQLSAPHLKPEKSTSFTIGTIFEPNKTYSATLDYYHITIRNQIISVGQLGQTGLDDAAALGTIIYRDSSQNILYDTYPFINANTTTTSGLDLDVIGKYDLHEAGQLKAEVQVSYMLQYDLTTASGKFHLAGSHGPAFVSEDTGTPRTRGAFTLTWGKGPFEIAGTVNYISHYSVLDHSEQIDTCDEALSSVFPDGNAPSKFCHVGSFTELNVVARYNVDTHLQLHAGVTNLLNKKAPYDLQTFGAPGNGAEQGGAPYNPSYHQDGAVGPMITLGGTYTF